VALLHTGDFPPLDSACSTATSYLSAAIFLLIITTVTGNVPVISSAFFDFPQSRPVCCRGPHARLQVIFRVLHNTCKRNNYGKEKHAEACFMQWLKLGLLPKMALFSYVSVKWRAVLLRKLSAPSGTFPSFVPISENKWTLTIPILQMYFIYVMCEVRVLSDGFIVSF
jgi:hypothetical protein